MLHEIIDHFSLSERGNKILTIVKFSHIVLKLHLNFLCRHTVDVYFVDYFFRYFNTSFNLNVLKLRNIILNVNP